MDNEERDDGQSFWEFYLYIAGRSSKSTTALGNLKKICEQHLAGKYRIETIDLLEHPHRAKQDQIFALPTLVRKQPLPIKTIIGDLSNTQKVTLGLELYLLED